MTQPILNSNVVTSIDHKAGSSPVLGQIPDHTQDELKELATERWAGICLPTTEALNNFGYHMTIALSSLNDLHSEDRIAVMKLTDGFLTTAENKRDQTKDHGNYVSDKLKRFNDRIHSGGDIDVNQQMELEESLGRLRQQWGVLNQSVHVLSTVRERMITELNLQNWPKRHNRQETQKSRASVSRMSADDPRLQSILRDLNTSRKPKTVPYTPRHNGIDDKSSINEYQVPADFEIPEKVEA
tara:strand:- start:931 stop:1653 length:723 start_codon:yes stop_codon:yes gene_type:complete